MITHMLVLAPTAIFVAALLLAFDVPQRLRRGLARLRPRPARRAVPAHGT